MHPPKEPELSSPVWDEGWLEWERRGRGQRAKDGAGPNGEERTFLALAALAV